MKKSLVLSTALAFAMSATSFALAGSDNGVGDGKGRSGPAGAISNGEPGTAGGTASVAGGLTGGWGGAAGVNNGNARGVEGKGDTPSGAGNNRGREQ